MLVLTAHTVVQLLTIMKRQGKKILNAFDVLKCSMQSEVVHINCYANHRTASPVDNVQNTRLSFLPAMF